MICLAERGRDLGPSVRNRVSAIDHHGAPMR
jgi:hypothetical protein